MHMSGCWSTLQGNYIKLYYIHTNCTITEIEKTTTKIVLQSTFSVLYIKPKWMVMQETIHVHLWIEVPPLSAYHYEHDLGTHTARKMF